MNIGVAIRLDREGKLASAARAYEDLLEAHVKSGEVLANLLVLYWQATDFGFWTTKGLSPEFVDVAGRRLWTMLSWEDSSLVRLPEYLFWSRYIRWADLNEGFSFDECISIMREYPDYPEPAMFAYAASEGRQMKREAEQLLESCSTIGTVRANYVTSVLSSSLGTRGGRRR